MDGEGEDEDGEAGRGEPGHSAGHPLHHTRLGMMVAVGRPAPLTPHPPHRSVCLLIGSLSCACLPCHHMPVRWSPLYYSSPASVPGPAQPVSLCGRAVAGLGGLQPRSWLAAVRAALLGMCGGYWPALQPAQQCTSLTRQHSQVPVISIEVVVCSAPSSPVSPPSLLHPTPVRLSVALASTTNTALYAENFLSAFCI